MRHVFTTKPDEQLLTAKSSTVVAAARRARTARSHVTQCVELIRPFLAVLAVVWAGPVAAQDYSLDSPGVVLAGIPFRVTLTSSDVILDDATASAYVVRVGEETFPMVFERDGGGRRLLVASNLRAVARGAAVVEIVHAGRVVARASPRTIAGWLSVVPPVLAIVIALVFRRVIPALFLGIWVGAWIIVGPLGFGKGLFDTFQVYVQRTLLNPDHVPIVLFTLMIGGMVGIIAKNGGMQGVVNRIVGWASTARRGQIATWLLGLIIFFDDYANTLVVGNTMRPITDRLRISREKLAYIVDSTAAPVACLAFVTTWIGYEVGIIGAAVHQIRDFDESPYAVFLSSIPYSFYPWLAILFVLVVAWLERDFGPMHRAEQRARQTGQVAGIGAKVDNAIDGGELKPVEGRPRRAVNAVLPIMVLVGGVILGLFLTGEGGSIREIIGSADSYAALMWASLAGVVVAAGLSAGQRILTLEEVVDAWYAGLKTMLFAIIILVLAWALSDVTAALHTASWLVSVLGEALPPGIVPALVFVISAATAFATGSSWGTMGILMPLVVPLVWAVLVANGAADHSHYHILYSTVACVLAGAVWGDHCSPISDTTILSSLTSGCDHIEHVRTQMPYALVVGAVAVAVGTVPAGFGVPWWVGLGLGAVLLVLALRVYGRPTAPLDRS